MLARAAPDYEDADRVISELKDMLEAEGTDWRSFRNLLEQKQEVDQQLALIMLGRVEPPTEEAREMALWMLKMSAEQFNVPTESSPIRRVDANRYGQRLHMENWNVALLRQISKESVDIVANAADMSPSHHEMLRAYSRRLRTAVNATSAALYLQKVATPTPRSRNAPSRWRQAAASGTASMTPGKIESPPAADTTTTGGGNRLLSVAIAVAVLSALMLMRWRAGDRTVEIAQRYTRGRSGG